MPSEPPRVVWLNGAFGAGKTTVASLVAARLPSAAILDPEPLGIALRAAVDPSLDDFQVLPAWRAATVRAVEGAGAAVVVVPMTVVDALIFDETVGELRRRGVDVRHVTLVVSASTLRDRLAEREGDTGWAESRVDSCVTALAAGRFAVHVDAERRLGDVVADVLAVATA